MLRYNIPNTNRFNLILLKTIRSLTLISILFLLNFQLFSQEVQLLEGEIIADSGSVANIHIMNLGLEIGTTSNTSGRFKIKARDGDTLFFSAVQFAHKKVVVGGASFQKLIVVELKEKFNELQEVQLDNISLSGVLSEDLDKVPESIYEKLGWSFPKPRRSSLELALHSAQNGGNLTSLLNLLNGNFKQLRKAKENNERAVKVNEGLAIVGKSFFVSRLQLAETEIINFLYFCVDDAQYQAFLESESLMRLLEYFESKIESFKELRELE